MADKGATSRAPAMTVTTTARYNLTNALVDGIWIARNGEI